MKKTPLLPLLVLLAACQAAPTPTPAPTARGGVEGLVAALSAAGQATTVAGNFSAEPVGGEGVTVCVGAEALQVYVFLDHEAALAAASKIDPQDPSKIGTSLVTWMGTPRFWLRENVLVLYLGQDAATDAVLRTVLDQPFAEGEAGPPPLRGPDCQ